MDRVISGIKMYAYADGHTPEREMIPSPYFKVLQTAVIEYAVIYPFAGSTFTVYIPVLLGIPGNTGLETQVSIVLYVDSTSITAGGTFCFMGTIPNAAASERTAVFMRIFYGIIAPWAHFVPRPAKGMPFLIKGDVIWGICGRFSPAIDVDECIHAPVFQQLVSNLSVEQIGGMLSCAESRQTFLGESPKPLRPRSSMA